MARQNCPSCYAANASDATFCGNCGKPMQTAAPPPRAGGTVVIGRDPSCGYIADKPMVSGRHCQLRFTLDQIEVTDLGSSNGTFVGRDRRRVASPVQIGPGDPVFLGSFQLPLAEIARSIGVQWPPPGKTAAARTVLEEAEPPPAKVVFAAERAELERERQRLQAERDASERAREANAASARETERAAARVAEAAVRIEVQQARDLAEMRHAAPAADKRSGFEKGANAAGAVAGFGIGCVMWVVCILIILGIIGSILANHH